MNYLRVCGLQGKIPALDSHNKGEGFPIQEDSKAVALHHTQVKRGAQSIGQLWFQPSEGVIKHEHTLSREQISVMPEVGRKVERAAEGNFTPSREQEYSPPLSL